MVYISLSPFCVEIQYQGFHIPQVTHDPKTNQKVRQFLGLVEDSNTSVPNF